MDKIKQFLPHVLAVFCSAIFLDSLRYKFTNHPKTQEIFNRLNEWTASLGSDGLFAQTGLFSQYTIGVAELIASVMLLVGILPRFRRLQGFGALIGLAVMSGAISFHLFTPLGIDPNNDGGGPVHGRVWGLVVLCGSRIPAPKRAYLRSLSYR